MSMDVYDRLVAVGWIERIHLEFSNDDFLLLHNVYKRKKKKNPNHITVAAQKINVGKAYKLLEAAYVRGADFDEIAFLMQYLVVCLDAEKYDLDIYEFKEAHKDLLNMLRDKYLKHG